MGSDWRELRGFGEQSEDGWRGKYLKILKPST